MPAGIVTTIFISFPVFSVHNFYGILRAYQVILFNSFFTKISICMHKYIETFFVTFKDKIGCTSHYNTRFTGSNITNNTCLCNEKFIIWRNNLINISIIIIIQFIQKSVGEFLLMFFHVFRSKSTSKSGEINQFTIIKGYTKFFSNAFANCMSATAILTRNGDHKIICSHIWLGYILNIFFSLQDRKSTRLNSSHVRISYAVFCLKKKYRL